MNVLPLTLSVAAAGSLSFGQEAGRPRLPIRSPLSDDGPLRTARKPVEQILKFSLECASVSVDRASWELAAKNEPEQDLQEFNQFRRGRNRPTSPIEMIFHRIQEQSNGTSRGSSGGRGEPRLERGFVGDELSGTLVQRGDSIRMALEESINPNRSLELVIEDDIAFRIQFTHPGGDTILVNQTRTGRFSAVAILGSRLFAGQGESYLAFRRKHGRDAEAHISPMLAPLGVVPFLSLKTLRHRSVVLALLRRSPETVAQGENLIAELNHESFDVREKATKELAERLGSFKDLIENKLKDKTNSPETQARLQSVLNARSEWKSAGDAVAAFELLKDPDYLVSLMDDATPEEIALLVGHLEKTTGQKRGRDPAAWKEWIAKSSP